MQVLAPFTVFTRHTIGNNSLFDTDMGLIETFVRCSKEPNNKLAQESVHSYFISQALAYWNNLEDFFKNNSWDDSSIGYTPGCIGSLRSSLYDRMEYRNKLYNESKNLINKNIPESEVNKIYPIPEDYMTNDENRLGFKIPIEYYDACGNSHAFNFNIIKRNISYFKEKFLQILAEVKNNFENNQRYSFEDILDLFQFIGNLFCLKISLDNYNLIDYDYKFRINPFLLTNTTGWFYYNTYMYALVEGITLLGMPAGNSSYDGFTGCPTKFLFHDLAHTENISKNYFKPLSERKNSDDLLNEKGINVRNMYYTVLSDDSLSSEEKEICILVMWYVVHEVTSSIFFTNEILSDPHELFLTLQFDTSNAKLEMFYQPTDRFKTFDNCIIFFTLYILRTFDIPGGKEYYQSFFEDDE